MSAPAVAAVETPAAAQIIVEAEERDRVDAQTYLDRMRTRLTGEGLDVVPVLMTGDPATIIDQLAREHEVELIAMTTHGRTGLGRLDTPAEGRLESGTRLGREAQLRRRRSRRQGQARD